MHAFQMVRSFCVLSPTNAVYDVQRSVKLFGLGDRNVSRIFSVLLPLFFFLR